MRKRWGCDVVVLPAASHPRSQSRALVDPGGGGLICQARSNGWAASAIPRLSGWRSDRRLLWMSFFHTCPPCGKLTGGRT